MIDVSEDELHQVGDPKAFQTNKCGVNCVRDAHCSRNPCHRPLQAGGVEAVLSTAVTNANEGRRIEGNVVLEALELGLALARSVQQVG
ncbi:hypothetical protein ACMHYB_02095 [Sorangium sp. So ce1128]